jgi:sugar-specific transcriptional regulator TrmB
MGFDSEFRSLLKKELDFKENHLILLEYMFNKKGKATAEELWENTEVPKGRIYDFLNDLTDWGFLEVSYSRPRGYILREPKQALMLALRRKERQLVDVERKILGFANSLENIWRIERGEEKLPKMELIPTAEDFYLRLITMLLDAREAKFSKKTPSLLLASERYTPIRRRYYNTLISRVNSNELKVQYLFPLEPTLALVNREDNKDVLKEVDFVMKHKNMDVRYTDLPSVTSLIIAGENCLLGFTSPKEKVVAKGIYFESSEITQLFSNLFDRVFEEASPLDNNFIQKIKSNMG